MTPPILSVLLFLTTPTSLAARPAPELLCLSDGQTVQVQVMRVRTDHRTVRLAGKSVDIPHDAIGANCTAQPVLADTPGLRRVVFSDGQSLLGHPVSGPGYTSVTLMDGQRVHFPEDAVATVETVRLQARPEPSPQSGRVWAPARALRDDAVASVAAQKASVNPFVGIGLTLLALAGGISFGLRRASKI